MKNNKIKPSMKVALASTLVATSTIAIAYARPSLAKNNTENIQDKLILDVQNLDGDTVKVSLDNIEDIPRALQFSLKLDGVVLKEVDGQPMIRDLVGKDSSGKIITDYTYNKAANTIDVLITSEDYIPKTGNEIEVFELDLEATSKNKSRNYSILPTENAEYKYVSNTNKEYTKSVSVSNESLALNTAPTITRSSEGYIEINEGEVLNLTKEVLESKGIVLTDAENDEITLEVKDANDDIIKNFTASTEGIYDLYITAIDSFGERSEVLNVQVKVNGIEQGPIITRDGKTLEDITINAGQVFDLMEGIKAVDVNGAPVAVQVKSDKDVNLDPEADVEYTITYTAVDNKGRTTVEEIKLTVKGNKAPIILGVEDHTLTEGEDFDPKANVTVEDEDEEIELVVNSNVNTKIPGTYKVVYSATDSGKKTTTAQSTVIVNPKKVEMNRTPVINANDIVIEVGDNFEPLDWVTATDYEDGPIYEIDVVENDVNTKVEGNYTVKYSVTDTQGATATKTIKVTVKKKLVLADSITINNKIDTLYVGSSKILTATINKEADVKDIKWTTSDANIVDIEVIGNAVKVFAKAEGDATITAQTMDGSNKSDSITIKVDKYSNVIPDFVNDIINTDIVIPVLGDASAEAPLEMEVQNVSVEKFNEFLKDLKKLNPVLERKYEDGNFTVYRIKAERKASILERFKRNTDVDNAYIELRIENNLDKASELKTELEKILKVTEEPGQGEDSGNTNTPGQGDNSGNGNNSGSSNDANEENLNNDKESSSLPLTGGKSRIAYVGGALTLIIAGVAFMIKKKK